MEVIQYGKNNIFLITFALVEGDLVDGWGFFLKKLRTHVAPQLGLYLITDKHASIKNAYNNPDNG